jgi:hypothetical protein
MAKDALSDTITNLDAVPVVKVNTLSQGGVVRSYRGMIGSAAFDALTAASVAAFCRIPARGRVRSIKLTHAAASTGMFELGLYRTPDNGGAVVDSNCFHTGVDIASARIAAEIENLPLAATRGGDVATAFAAVISTASATADTEFDLCATITTIMGTASAVEVDVEVVLPE